MANMSVSERLALMRQNEQANIDAQVDAVPGFFSFMKPLVRKDLNAAQAQRDAERDNYALQQYTDAQAAGLDFGQIPNIMDALQVSPNVAANLAENPDVPLMPSAQGRRDIAVQQAQRQLEQTEQQRQLEIIQAQQQVEQNRQSLMRNGFTPEQLGKVDLGIRTSMRALGSLEELNSMMTLDENLLKGGAAAMTGYIQKSLMPTVMELINTGVINSPAELERVESFIPNLTGADGLITLGSTNKAKIKEFARWISGKVSDTADAYQLNLNAYGNSFQPRSAEELKEAIASYSSEPSESALQSKAQEGYTPIETSVGDTLKRAIFPRGAPDLPDISLPSRSRF